MPVVINFPPRVRFTLYLLAAIALLVVGYLVDKGWAGDAEVRLITGAAALLNLLAAAKTDFDEPGSTAELVASYRGEHERGATDLQHALVVIGILLVVVVGYMLLVT